MSMLKVDNLSVHYGMIQAVRDVSFEVNEGEVVSLIGANGAGKTSLLMLWPERFHSISGGTMKGWCSPVERR